MTMARPIKATKTNRNVLEPYILATSKYHFTAYEKRILYRLIEFAQRDIEKATNGEPIKNHMRPLCVYKKDADKAANGKPIEDADKAANGKPMHPLYVIDLFDGDKEFAMYISDILDTCGDGESGNHYERVKEAFRKLQTKLIEFEDDDVYISVPFLYRLKIQKRTGVAEFRVTKEFWSAILNFTKGFRKYELITAMKLKSPYSMRFYELISRQTTPLKYSVEQIREMFALENKYKQPASIRKRIIEPAKEELDKSAPYSFELKEIRLNEGKKTSPITHFMFIPYRIDENQDKELQRIERQSKLTARNLFADSNIYTILRYNLDFDVRAMTVNKKTIAEGKEVIPDFIGFLTSLVDSKKRKESSNPIGYVIGAIKRKINDIAEGKNVTRTRHTNRSETAIQKEDMNYDDTETW